MKYEDMTNLEINRLVAKKTGGYIGDVGDYMKDGVKCKVGTLGYQECDYCNNPNDAWPIILECFMDVELSHPLLGGTGTCTIYNPYGTDWQVDFNDNSESLRAAMICFLKMKDKEK